MCYRISLWGCVRPSVRPRPSVEIRWDHPLRSSKSAIFDNGKARLRSTIAGTTTSENSVRLVSEKSAINREASCLQRNYTARIPFSHRRVFLVFRSRWLSKSMSTASWKSAPRTKEPEANNRSSFKPTKTGNVSMYSLKMYCLFARLR